jgi:signal transduction histidine kinase
MIILFTLPLYLNHKHKHDLANTSLLTIVIVGMSLSTMLFNYQSSMKFGVIVPLTILSWIYYQRQKKYIIISTLMTLIYVALAIYIEFSHLGQPRIYDKSYILYDFLFFFAVLISFIIFQGLNNLVEEKLTNRLIYEKGIINFSNIILKGNPEAINTGLHILLKTSNASRIYIFKNILDKELGLCCTQTNEVCQPGVKPEINNKELQQLPYEAAGFGRWQKILSHNDIIKGNIEDFPEIERNLLEAQAIKSILVIPIFEANKWIGFIGFDNVYNKRLWQKEDISLLKTAADLLSLYFQNKKHQNTIIKRNQELNQANETKNKLLSILAHDLKNPFHALNGFSELLIDTLKNVACDNALEYAKIINESSNHTHQLLENLLIWIKTHDKAISLSPERLDITSMVNENINLAHILAEQKKLTLINSIPNYIQIHGDKRMLNTVFRNLLSNAIKFTHDGGKITIGISYLTKSEVGFFIEDTGIGIKLEHLPYIFNLRNTNPSKGTRGESGTGLGLHLCKDFIEQHNGKISVSSVVDKGTTFYIKLPINVSVYQPSK